MHPLPPLPLLEDVNINSDSDFDQEELEEIEELMGKYKRCNGKTFKLLQKQ